MCGSMVDIQSAAAEIRRGKKIEEDRRYKETTGQKYTVSHKKGANLVLSVTLSNTNRF